MKKTYLITGATGHLGNVITNTLTDNGDAVRALVLPHEKFDSQKAETFYGDVRDKESMRPCFENLSGSSLVVIHCAGIVTIATKSCPALYDVNVSGTKNIVDLCREYNVAKLVYVSSVHAIPEKPKGTTICEISEFDPDSVVGGYAKTKAEATAYVLEAAKQGLNACVIHPSGITGPYDYGRGHMTTMIIDYCKRRLSSGVKGGYDFVDVRDVANGIISACDKGRRGECYILSNNYYKIKEIFTMLQEISGRKIKSYMPIWLAKATAPLAELYYKMLKQPPLFTAYSIYTLNSNSLFSRQKAFTELGYTTRPMRETLRDTVNWLKGKGRI